MPSLSPSSSPSLTSLQPKYGHKCYWRLFCACSPPTYSWEIINICWRRHSHIGWSIAGSTAVVGTLAWFISDSIKNIRVTFEFIALRLSRQKLLYDLTLIIRLSVGRSFFVAWSFDFSIFHSTILANFKSRHDLTHSTNFLFPTVILKYDLFSELDWEYSSSFDWCVKILQEFQRLAIWSENYSWEKELQYRSSNWERQ